MVERKCSSLHRLEGRYCGHKVLKGQRAAELTVLELEGEKLRLRVLEPEAPQNAQLEGAAPQQEYLQLAGPRLEEEQSGV